MIPCFTTGNKTLVLERVLLLTNRFHVYTAGTIKGAEAPANNSILSTSNSVGRQHCQQVQAGAWLSIPSINWFIQVLPLLQIPWW